MRGLVFGGARADSIIMTAGLLRTAVPIFRLPVERGQSGKLVEALGPWLLRGWSVWCLDAGNVFDPLPLARWLRAQGGNARVALEEQVFVSRAYTCHQLATAARQLLAPLGQGSGAGIERAECAALITRIESMFLDEDIPLFERRFLFTRTLQEAAALAQQGVPVLLTHAAGPANDWTRQLARAARPLAEIQTLLPDLRSQHDGTHPADIQHLP